MTKTDIRLRDARPTEVELALEFPTARRQELLDQLLSAHPAPGAGPADITDHGLVKRPIPRYRGLAVAAGVLIVAGATIGVQFAPSRSTVEPHSPAPAGGILQPPAAAAATLTELAARADLGVEVPAGAYRMVEQRQGDGLTINAYVASDGWMWRRDTRPGSSTFYAVLPPTGDRAPKDPAALRQWLEQRATGTESRTHAMFKETGELVSLETTPAAVRAAAIRVLSALADEPGATLPRPKDPGQTTPEVRVERADQNGRQVLIARFTDRSRPTVSGALTFDAETSELLADSSGSDAAQQTNFRRETVTVLPADIVGAVGTERRERQVTRR